MAEIIQTVVTIIYVIVTVLLILVVLLQAGRGGGLGLSGGTSQSVLGGGGGDFMSKFTAWLASGFMVMAVYLAYAGAHSGSSALKSQTTAPAASDGPAAELNAEQLGPNPLPLPAAGEAVPTSVEVPAAPADVGDQVEAAPSQGEPSGVAAQVPADAVDGVPIPTP